MDQSEATAAPTPAMPSIRPVLPLLYAAMAIFVITVIIGILNGLDIWDVPHGVLMAHVHSGTLGWITLSIFAGAAWVFGAERLSSALIYSSIGAVVLYIVAFWFNLTNLRPMTGTLMVIVMFWFAAWTFMQKRGLSWTLPRLSMLLAMVNLCIGGVLGVILGLMHAGMIEFNEGMAGAHPTVMVVGYLILAATGLAEQLVDGPGADKLSKGGIIQAWGFFIAGIALAVGILLDFQPLFGVNLLLEVVGVGLVLGRNRTQLAAAGWGVPSVARAGATAMVFLVPTVAVLIYLIVRYADNVESVPHLLIALDHLTFIGILTNVIFGLILVAALPTLKPTMDQVRFWGMNIGLVFFAAGLLAQSSILKQIGTPLLGLAILHGIATTAMAIRKAPAE